MHWVEALVEGPSAIPRETSLSSTYKVSVRVSVIALRWVSESYRPAT
jgi:hypothetical protein